MLLQYTLYIFAFLLNNVVSLQLAPISNPADIIGTSVTSKREASFTGDLDLQDFETFFWGAPAGDKLIYANFTVYFPDQYEYVIAMERFAGMLKSVSCTEDMMLEFIDQDAFKYAQGVWNWVNQDVNNSFIMVTNYEGCSDDMERLPFVVSNIRYDEAQRKAYLTADLQEWEDIAHSYTLHVGHTPLTPAHRMLMARDLIPKGVDFTLNLASAWDKNLFSTTIGGWTTSVDAAVRTTGKINVDFDVDVHWLKIKSAALTINPEDVAASIQLALTEQGTLAQPYNWQKTIISIPIEGIKIAKIVKLGAFLDVDVGFTMDQWNGTATANIGAKMEISNEATVVVDLVKSKNNKFSGWTPTFSATPLTLDAKVEGSAQAFAEPNVKLEASALGKGFNVALGMKMPYIKADFAALVDTNGVCQTQKTFGVNFNSKIGVELSVQAAKKGKEANPFWEKRLYSNEWDLYSKCFAFGPEAGTPNTLVSSQIAETTAASALDPFISTSVEVITSVAETLTPAPVPTVVESSIVSSSALHDKSSSTPLDPVTSASVISPEVAASSTTSTLDPTSALSDLETTGPVITPTLAPTPLSTIALSSTVASQPTGILDNNPEDHKPSNESSDTAKPSTNSLVSSSVHKSNPLPSSKSDPISRITYGNQPSSFVASITSLVSSQGVTSILSATTTPCSKS